MPKPKTVDLATSHDHAKAILLASSSAADPAVVPEPKRGRGGGHRGPRPRAAAPSPHDQWREMPSATERAEGLSRSRLYELAAEGVVRTRKVGGTVLVNTADIRAFIEAQPPAALGSRGGRKPPQLDASAA